MVPRSLATTLALVALAGPPLRADIVPEGPEFLVNTYTPAPQRRPDVAGHTDGSFLVVWQRQLLHRPGRFGTGVFGQRFTSAGSPVGPEFQVNTYTPSHQFEPTVAVDGTGRFTVAWTSGGYGSYLPSQDGSVTFRPDDLFRAQGAPAGCTP